METIKLTNRQQQILDLIHTAIQNTGAPPTRAEIATELGFKSPNAAEEHLQALARKGVIQLVSGTSRGIRLKSQSTDLASTHLLRPFQTTMPGLSQLLLPLVGRVAAGAPILAQEHIEQTYPVQASMFQQEPDFLLKVKGLSMRNVGIMDGDLLAVKSTSEARNGQIVVARLGEEVTVKRLQKTPQGYSLHPENPDFQAIQVRPGEPFHIEGLAVGLIRTQL